MTLKGYFIALLAILVLAAGCDNEMPTATPDLQAMVAQAIEEAIPHTATPNVPATVAAQVQARLAMVLTATPYPSSGVATPTPTYTPLPTPNPTATNYIWIPKYADPRMADKMINSYPATVVTLCRGIFGGAWSPNDPGYWETFDICAVNAQLGFPDPTGVATKGCVSSDSGCKRYRLKE